MSSDVSSPSSLSSKKAKLQNPRGVGGEQRQEKEDQLEEEEVKIKTEFRNVFYSTSKDISDVCGPRVRFTCIDCNERVVALGANTGSVYCFARTYVEKKTKKKKDGDKEEEEKKNSSVSSTEEGRLRFLAVISPQSIKRTDAQTGRTMVTSQVIQKVKLSPDGNMAAIAYASGVLHVISFKSGSSNNSSNSSTPPAGRTIALLRKAHASQIITALTWSNDGNVVYCGDDAGMVTLTDVSAFTKYFKTGDGSDVLKKKKDDAIAGTSTGSGSSNNKNKSGGGGNKDNSNSVGQNESQLLEFEPIFCAKFVKCDSLLPGMEDGSEACYQIDCSKSNLSTLLSSRSKASVLAVNSGEQEVIGTKPRDGSFGACFHEMCKSAIGMDYGEEGVEKKREWALCSRPGRRLWITTVEVNEGDEVVPKVDVVATLRPDLPWPTTPTILGYPESCFEFKSNSDRIKRMQKRFEFGTLTPFGDDNRMCLSVAQKSVAIVDVARATVAEWFPLREPETIARGNFASGFSDFAVSGRSVFFLTKSATEPTIEAESSVGSIVWCFEVSSDEDSTKRKEVRELCKVDTSEQPMVSSSSSVVVSGNAHAANIEEKAAILAKLAKEVKPKPPSKLELLKQQHSLEANSDSEEVLYDEEVYPKISNASDVNAIFFYNPSGKSRKREAQDEKICAKAIVSGLLDSEFNCFSEDPELMELFEGLDLLGLDPTRNYDQRAEMTRASTGHAAAAMAMHEQNLLAEKNGEGNKMDEDDSRKHPSSSSRSGKTNTKSPIHRLKENHHEQPETPRTPKTTDDVLTSHEILNVSRECCDPSSTRQDMTLALQAVPSIAAKTIVIESSRALFVRLIQDVFSDDENIKALSKSLENLALSAGEVLGADAVLRCLKVACEDPDVRDHAEASALDTPSGAMLSHVVTNITLQLINEHHMDSSLRAVTVETPSVQEQEYIDDDAIKRLSTSSRSNRGNRRSVTFADASTQGGFEDQRVNNAMQLEQKTVDDHDEKKKSKRNAMNTMSSFTRRALGSRASMVETTTGGKGQEEEEDLKREKKERDHQKLSSSSSYYSQSHASSWRTFRRRGKEVCRKILDNKCTSIFMTLATIWALFGDDVRVLAFPMEYDEIFVGVAIALIVLFALETTMSVFCKRQKFMAFVGMDPCEGTDSYGTGLEGEAYDERYGTKSENSGDIARAGRASRAGTRAGRLVRVVRLIRVVKLYSSLQQKKNAKEQKERRASIARSSMISSSSSISSSIHNQDIREEMLQVRKSYVQSLESVNSSSTGVSAKGSGGDFETPLVKKNSLTQAEEFDDMSDDDLEQSRVGERLSELSTRRVIIGVLLMLFMMPIFAADFFDAGETNTLIDGGLKIVHDSARFDPNDDQARLGFFQALNRYYEDTGEKMYRLVINGTSYEQNGNFSNSIGALNDDDPLSYLYLNLSGVQYPKLRCEAFEFAMYSGDGENEQYDKLSFAFFDVSKVYKLQSVLNIAKTIFVCIVLLLGALLFSKDANVLVLRPIERMVLKVQAMAANPLTKFSIRPHDDELESEGEQLETRMLENSIARICSLLSVGFGEAGTEVIAENMKRGGEINPMIPGRKVLAIFGFCDIRQFTDSTEVLQEEVMEYVNTIGKIVHMEAHLHGGSANKNIGDAFLLVWKFPPNITTRDVELASEGLLKDEEKLFVLEQIADGALVSFLAVMAGLRRSAKLSSYKSNKKLNKRMPNFQTQMGFGLHVGWAIEGAIGSEYKVDASYLSPNVNISARLEAATKQFETPLLFTGQFANILSESTRTKCRQIDHVTVKGSEQPLKLYTCDVDVEAIPVPTQEEILSGRSYEDETNSFQLYENPFLEHPDVALMRKRVSEEFLTDFEQEIEDGPTKSLLAVMERTNYRAPNDWSGFRALTEK
ncbi:unnamed protein product [Bathycoccus prasinos]